MTVELDVDGLSISSPITTDGSDVTIVRNACELTASGKLIDGHSAVMTAAGMFIQTSLSLVESVTEGGVTVANVIARYLHLS